MYIFIFVLSLLFHPYYPYPYFVHVYSVLYVQTTLSRYRRTRLRVSFTYTIFLLLITYLVDSIYNRFVSLHINTSRYHRIRLRLILFTICLPSSKECLTTLPVALHVLRTPHTVHLQIPVVLTMFLINTP